MTFSLNNFLREVAPGAGAALLMMFLYPFVLVLFMLACVLAVLPLLFAFGAYGSGEYLFVPVWVSVCAGVVFAEYKFYKWSAAPGRSIRGFKEKVAIAGVTYLILSAIFFEVGHFWAVNHSDGGYGPVVFFFAAPEYIGLALSQPFMSGRSFALTDLFNMWEAFAWCAIGLLCAAYSLWKPVSYRMKLLFFSGINFLVFGLTDIYEMHTGAWWDPLGLLVIKVSCILAFATLYLLYRKDRSAVNI
jgi:hypothetical protein